MTRLSSPIPAGNNRPFSQVITAKEVMNRLNLRCFLGLSLFPAHPNHFRISQNEGGWVLHKSSRKPDFNPLLCDSDRLVSPQVTTQKQLANCINLVRSSRLGIFLHHSGPVAASSLTTKYTKYTKQIPSIFVCFVSFVVVSSFTEN